MAIRTLDRSEWVSYLDRVSETLGTKKVTIEIAGLEIGHQVEAKSVALSGLVYDRKSDVLEVQTQGLDHLIHKPTEIYVDESILGVTSLEVVDGDGNRQILSLVEPLLLEEDVPHEVVADARTKLSELLEDLKTERDELRVRSHLLKAELREEWDELEEKWRGLEPQIEHMGKNLAHVKEDFSAAATRAAVEMRRAYQRIRDRFD